MDWSPIRTYTAVLKFDEKVNQIASSFRFPNNLYKTGFGYSKIYPNIIEAKDKFINKIKILEWDCPWPYSDLDDAPFATFKRKFLNKFGNVPLRNFFLVNKEIFYEAANEFIESLLTSSIEREKFDYFITHNALEPFDPQNNIKILGKDAKCIVVDRDPRDIFATAISYQKGYNADPKFYSRVAGAHDIDIFIQRYLTYRRNINFESTSVLRLDFEELILNYEQEIIKVYEFLDISKNFHKSKKTYFDPLKSKNNTKLYKNKKFEQYKADFDLINTKCII